MGLSSFGRCVRGRWRCNEIAVQVDDSLKRLELPAPPQVRNQQVWFESHWSAYLRSPHLR